MSVFFTEDHEWISVDGDIGTVGISPYAAKQLGDVVYVELPDVGRDQVLVHRERERRRGAMPGEFVQAGADRVEAGAPTAELARNHRGEETRPFQIGVVLGYEAVALIDLFGSACEDRTQRAGAPEPFELDVFHRSWGRGFVKRRLGLRSGLCGLFIDLDCGRHG